VREKREDVQEAEALKKNLSCNKINDFVCNTRRFRRAETRPLQKCSTKKRTIRMQYARNDFCRECPVFSTHGFCQSVNRHSSPEPEEEAEGGLYTLFRL